MNYRALKAPLLTILAFVAGMFVSSCETQTKNSRNRVAKDYGTIPDILEYTSANSSSKGMSSAGLSSVSGCLGNSSLAAEDDKTVSASTAVENMAAVLDQGLACAVAEKLGAEDLGSFYNTIVAYFALLPRTRLETMTSMQKFSDILVKYLAMLDDSETITEILEKTISDNLSTYNDAGAGISYADIAASISQTAGSAFVAESISSTQATSILSSLGTAAGILAVTAKEEPADGAQVFSDILSAYFDGVGNISTSNFSDVSTMANALAEKFSSSYGASLGASDAASFLSEANSNV